VCVCVCVFNFIICIHNFIICIHARVQYWCLHGVNALANNVDVAVVSVLY
jgi:hypothetical protein